MAIQKRFIAGAICPRCAEMDRIRSWEQNGIRYRECVSCDFFEQLPIEEQAAPELATRIDRTHREEPTEDFQTVKIIDPKG
ncbi:YheV family putative metal-binding protein [Halomonas sp. KAO]|uniref:YheV family putative zinc ribbon protein n=1 Tax=unclassified Halomonas TaxID=2609666 RepID=UPI00189CB050|nr:MULTISPECIES: YheV family putative zinc ribbon protein [unclassified Halomonas]MBF7054364.1 YheV family putative metal-binding protein [Halomonas sp. KAO]MDT0499887.1 YheV family putative zinc ribbon protein [Halomonas sp. PAR7]MDT0512292.1 YheV family putative zinc ribbon protein [Halomonas sp. LES1]MDT0590925.1 YheV family putative zinc ribbon protein [Halomonas sp. PAR8]